MGYDVSSTAGTAVCGNWPPTAVVDVVLVVLVVIVDADAVLVVIVDVDVDAVVDEHDPFGV
jgi:hypothetical protein